MQGGHGELEKFQKVALRNLSGNCPQEVLVRCTLFQVDRQLPHSHKLVTKKSKYEDLWLNDPHIVHATQDGVAVFSGFAIIQTTKKNLADEWLKKVVKLAEFDQQRTLSPEEIEKIKRDAKNEVKGMRLHQARLCFQAFGRHDGRWSELCAPVFSGVINNSHCPDTGELKIFRLCPATGGTEVFLLVEKVNRKTVQVRFFETDHDDNLLWESFATVKDVHRQCAIVIETPEYHNRNIDSSVTVNLELLRGESCSNIWKFTYEPPLTCSSRKRARTDDDFMDNVASDVLDQKLQEISSIPTLCAVDLVRLLCRPLPKLGDLKKVISFFYLKTVLFLVDSGSSFGDVRDKLAKVFNQAHDKGHK